MTFLERIGVELPVVQAGMGGGLSRHELAAAVSEAGGLGTIAVNGADAIRRELDAGRALTGRPLAVNLLLLFARREWFAAATGADVVVAFSGGPERRTPGIWMHQCGSWLAGRRRSLPAPPMASVCSARCCSSPASSCRARPHVVARCHGVETAARDPELVVGEHQDVAELIELPAFQRTGRAIVRTDRGGLGILSTTATMRLTEPGVEASPRRAQSTRPTPRRIESESA